MKRAVVYITLLCICSSLMTYAKNLRVQLQAGKIKSTVTFTAVNSNYYVYAGKKRILTVKQNQSLKINATDNTLLVASVKKIYGPFGKIKIISKDPEARFALLSKEYYDHLEIIPKNQNLRCLNVVDLEKYVEGTVAAEAGHDAEAEFYKVQAIIARTYALGHLQRHAHEGFNLCDQVHCQAYNGIAKDNKTITDAVHATGNKIIVDSALEIITAAYHSNCGGQTAGAEDVWSKSLPYLQSVEDPFCFNGNHAWWEQKISLDEWLSYLKKKNMLTAFTDATPVCDITFCYFPLKREALFFLSNSAVAMRTIRDDWKFKSAYFTINQVGDTVIFNGRGYGHGVGVCQEGAMQMAKLNHSFEQIIDYYYKGVAVVDADVLSFLKEK